MQQQLETATHAKILLGWCDPKEAADPDVFVRSLELLLSAYPSDVQRIVVDPRSAVIERIKRTARENREWISFIDSVRRACEDIYGPTRRRLEREAVIAVQLAEREKIEAEDAARPTADELRAKYGDNYGLNPTPEPTSDEAAGARRMKDFSWRAIEREYSAMGKEPVTTGGLIISQSLIRSIKNNAIGVGFLQRAAGFREDQA